MNTKSLLIKDYFSIKQMRFLPLIVGAIFAVFSVLLHYFDGPESAAESVLIIAPILSAMTGFAMFPYTLRCDEESGFMIQALSSPISRKEYMKSKYFLALICFGIAASVGELCSLLALAIELSADPMMYVKVIAAGFAAAGAAMLINVWIIVLGLNFTANAGSYIFVGIVLLNAMNIMLHTKLINEGTENEYAAIITAAIAVFIIATAVSFFAGFRKFEKKEL